jgi:hypothetical protein
MKISPDSRPRPDICALVLGASMLACAPRVAPPSPPPVSLAFRVATTIREGDTSYNFLVRPDIVPMLALPGELSLAVEQPLPADMVTPPGAERFDGRLFVAGDRASEVASWPAPPGMRFLPDCTLYDGGAWRCHAILLGGPFLPPSEVLQATYSEEPLTSGLKVRFSEQGAGCFDTLLDDNPGKFLAFVRLDAAAAAALGGPMQDCGAPR